MRRWGGRRHDQGQSDDATAAADAWLYTCSPGMWQLWEIQPDVVHPGVGTTDVWRYGPALDKIPAHVIQVKPVEDEVGGVIHGQFVHLPDEPLACLKLGSEFLLFE